jgi:ketosteroid isomerase-like protein
MKLPVLVLIATLGLAGDPRQEMMDADRAFDRATAVRGLDGWMSYFAPDARLNLRSGILEGRANIRAHYAKMFAQPEFSIRWEPLFAEASADGTLGYTLGKARISFRMPDGTREQRPGNYLTVWKKQKDGAWKAATDIGN